MEGDDGENIETRPKIVEDDRKNKQVFETGTVCRIVDDFGSSSVIFRFSLLLVLFLAWNQ